jgi:hypothetical protein
LKLQVFCSFSVLFDFAEHEICWFVLQWVGVVTWPAETDYLFDRNACSRVNI